MRIPCLLLVIIALTAPQSSLGQWIGEERIDPSTVEPWAPDTSTAYEGVYRHKGEHGGTLRLFWAGGQWYAQLKRNLFKPRGGVEHRYDNLKQVRVRDTSFHSTIRTGTFVTYEKEGKRRKGLKVSPPWGGYQNEDAFEILPREGSLSEHLHGAYPEASTQLLDVKALRERTDRQLRIMRNEIFARYGYTFEEGGEMDAYFSQKDWYTPQHEDVGGFLTEVEQKNLKRIQRVEASSK